MPWLRAGDNAATHPIVLRVWGFVRAATGRVPERDVAVNEVFGFVMRCALQSAGHTTDYVIDEGTALMIAGGRTERLLGLAKKAGYLKPAKKAGQRVWLLIDEPDFIHMITKAERDWNAQQRADAANPQLIVPVRLRDGDACRYCGMVVNWRDRRGGRGGTYDHREPATAATTETLVVACKSCNSGRRDRADADERYPLRPAPPDPYYSQTTAEFLAGHGHAVTPTADQRPASQADTATPRPPTQGDNAPATRPARPDDAQPATPMRSGGTLAGSKMRRESVDRIQKIVDHDGAASTDASKSGASRHRKSAETADRLGDEPGFAGTGRDGSTGQLSGNPAGTAARASPQPRRRSARGRPRTGGDR